MATQLRQTHRSSHPHQDPGPGGISAGYKGATADDADDPAVEAHPTNSEYVAIEASAPADGHSFQPISADLDVAPAAGNVATNPKFLAPIMGNAGGDSLTAAGAYLAGVIAALSITGAKATHYQVAALLGIVMDGVTDADGAVVAVIDGSDPSSPTRANAAFAARQNNAHASSGVDYGLDLFDPGRGADFTGGAKPFAIAKAIERSPAQVCRLEGAGAPVDGGSGTGAGFAAGGSLYTRTQAGSIAVYINTGTAASPAWKAITHA